MGHTSIGLGIALAGLAGLALWLAWGDRLAPTARGFALVALVAVALLGHTNSLTRDSATDTWVAATPAIHLHEYLHYYLGTKYFRELGHERLYEAIVTCLLYTSPSPRDPE